jgi:hypothetical protein
MSGLDDNELSSSTADLFGLGAGSGTGRAAGISNLLRSPTSTQDHPTAAKDEQTGARWIPIEGCVGNPRNPRDDIGDLSDLESIREIQHSSCTGVTPAAYLKLWPEDRDKIPADAVVVLITGNRRLKASYKYGRDKLLVVTDDSIAKSKATLLRAAYDENTGRRDFDPVEEAKAALSIIDQYRTAKEACAAEGWTQSWISQRRALLRLHPDIQALVRSKARGEDGISLRKARWLGAREGIEGLGPDEQLALLIDYPEAGAQKRRKTKGESRGTAPRAAGIPPQSGEPFTAVNQDRDPKSGASEGRTALRPATATNGDPSSGPHGQRTTTMSAVDVLRQLAHSLAELSIPTDPDVVDRAKAEDPESAQLELGRIKGCTDALERLVSRGQETSD